MQALAIIAAMVVSMIFAAVVESFLSRALSISEAVTTNLTSIVEYLLMFGLTTCIAVSTRLRLFHVFGASPSWSLLPVAALYALLLLGFTCGENFIEVYIVSQRAPAFAYSYWHFHSKPYILDVSWLGYVLLISAQFILGPFVEEFVFRGLLFRMWTERYGMLVGIFLSSILFTALHYSRHYDVSTFIFAVAMCLLYIRYQSLWVNVFVHGAFNALAFVIQFLLNAHWQKTVSQLGVLASWKPDMVMFITSTPVLVLLAVKYWPRDWPAALDARNEVVHADA